MSLKVALVCVMAALLVLFTAQNYKVVELRLLFWKIEMSHAVMILGVLAIGILLGWLSRGLKA